ncbi:MAG: arginine--tRNA ligase [Candidatus Nanohaloarchaea archaeon]
MKEIKRQLSQQLSNSLGTQVTPGDIERPEPEHGDFAYPVMKAASRLGKEPRKLAEKTAEELEAEELVDRVEVAGPGYLNFYLDRQGFAEQVVQALEDEKFGVEQREGKALVEFSSPNVAKPMHVGHFRNNALGDSLQRIMRFVGYDVTSENYLGDWGTQYGKLIYAFKEFGSEEEFEEAPMEHMFDLYVRFHEEMEEDEEIEEKGREWAAKIEEGDEEAVELWEKFRDASIEYHKKDYRRMDIEFDRWTGESKVVEGARNMVEKWIDEGKLDYDEDGSVFMEFEEHDLPGTVILKADGSTLYLTRDLYNLKKRNDEGFDLNMYVVASEQDLHFQQVFAAAEELGLDPEGSAHVSYGLLSLPEGSMSSREGRIIRLEDAMDEARERAEEKAEEKMERQVENAEAIGIGALKYANLAVSKKKNIEFDWDRALSFEGDSGPYLQYSNTRAKSILEKAGAEAVFEGEFNEEEYRLLKKLSEFPEAVESAAEQREPAKIANYLSGLCEEFNTFYHECQVIDAGSAEKRRLKLVELFEDVTATGLELLGIEDLEEM